MPYSLDDFKRRRREAFDDTLRRWQDRSKARGQATEKVDEDGAGLADSPMRQARFAARQTLLKQAVQLSVSAELPLFLERKIGPTLDFLGLAPNAAAQKAGIPVARLVTSVDPHVEAEGFATGFLVAPNLLLTNRHVFPDRESAIGTGANFLYEADAQGRIAIGITFPIDSESFIFVDEELDFSLVGIKPNALTGESIESLGCVSLTEATSKILIGQPIEIIQYPDGGPKQYATSNNRLLDVVNDCFIHYQTDTLEGSSGSPAFSESWELVALHHAGIPETRDGQIMTVDELVWQPDMGDDRIKWIANEGIRASAIVHALSNARLDDASQESALRALLATTTDPADDVVKLLADGPLPEKRKEVIGTKRESAPSPFDMTPGPDMANNFTFTGPVTMHVYAAMPSSTTVPASTVLATSALEKTLRFDPNYEDRGGYDEAFLGNGLIVPMPQVSVDRLPEMLMDGGAAMVLPYHHYSLAMNKERRLQMWSAVNVDYDPALRKQSGRASFGTDRWVGDPRIPANVQIADPDFYGPATQIDRGHIVRREDSAWGADALQTEYANSDTFHWTNCTPQHQAFNRASPGTGYGAIKGLWGAFENYVQKSLQTVDTKACILAGPALASDDPSADFGTGLIQYPIVFWKVVVVSAVSEGENKVLKAYGFVISQKDVVDEFGIEFTAGQYARYQTSLTEISKLAGVIFADVLMEVDTAR